MRRDSRPTAKPYKAYKDGGAPRRRPSSQIARPSGYRTTGGGAGGRGVRDQRDETGVLTPVVASARTGGSLPHAIPGWVSEHGGQRRCEVATRRDRSAVLQTQPVGAQL